MATTYTLDASGGFATRSSDDARVPWDPAHDRPLDIDGYVGRIWVDDGSPASIAAPAPPVDLVAYAAAMRYARETGGITVSGMAIATDRDSQAMITGAYSYVLAKPDATTAFKVSSGWITLSADQIQAIALAVGAHVQACFAAEQQVDAALSASPPTVTTTAQVEAAFAAVTA